MDRYGMDGGIIELRKCEITQLEIEGIICPTNTNLTMETGIPGLIRRHGGRIIEEEAVSFGPLEIGEAIATVAGDLDVRCIIHGAVAEPNTAPDIEDIQIALRSCLELAEDHQLETVAVSSFYESAYNMPLKEVARAMIDEVTDFLKENKPQMRIMFTLSNYPEFNVFKNFLEAA